MNTFREEFKTAIKNTEDLKLFLDCDIPHTSFPLFLPIKFLEKVKNSGPNSALWKQFIPNAFENNSKGMLDPIGDQRFLVTKNLIHRYRNRALFLPTTNCPVACRYCFRKNELGESETFKSDLKSTLEYLKSHPEIEEIIFTGGDPLILSDEKILEYAIMFKEIPSIQYLRFHTRTLSIIPSRVTPTFLEKIKEIKTYFKQVCFVLHFNHPSELDAEVIKAISDLKSTHVHLFSQTVLLKEVNDDPETLRELFLNLSSIGVIPYYLHHPDRAFGTDHFYLDLEAGRKIYSKLRINLPGWMIPQYIIDIPGGEGKVSAFNPEHFHFEGKLLNVHGDLIQI